MEKPKENVIVSTGFVTIDVKDKFKNVIDPYYLYLLLIQDEITEYLGTIADTAVSSYPSLNPSDIQMLEFEFPDLSIQKKIASVPYNIDKRIENLRAQNRVLEQTAKTIYDYTFLQCAGHQTTYNKTLNRNIPADWEVKKLGDLVTIKNGRDHKHLIDGPFAVYGSGGLMRKVDSFLYDGESVLIPRKGTLNNVMYVDEKFWTVDTMFYTVMNKPYYGKYVYYSVKDIDFMARNSGTGVPSMTSGYLNTISIILPDTQTLENFNNQVTPLFKKVQLNAQQIETLTIQRNTLLPLLMTGQVEG
jgi:type I restriction enzyme S subunit